MTTRRVAWRRSDEIETDEHCTLTVRDSGLSLVGTVLGAEAGAPIRIEYRVLTDGAVLMHADGSGVRQLTDNKWEDAVAGWAPEKP